jgi:hypothetical protein
MVERKIVVLVVVGSNPISHPIFQLFYIQKSYQKVLLTKNQNFSHQK